MFLQLDREKQAEAVLQELASIIARYRGPLLESSVDLEQRLWHLATMTGEVSDNLSQQQGQQGQLYTQRPWQLATAGGSSSGVLQPLRQVALKLVETLAPAAASSSQPE
jgi:hypothetical protein